MNSNIDPASDASGRCLIVDDDPQVLKLMRLCLARFHRGELCCFESGAEALSFFAMAPQTFQLGIIDLNIAPTNGVQLAARLRVLAPHLKTVLVTGDGEVISRAEARQLGFSALLYKPFSVARLRSLITELTTEGCVSRHAGVSRQSG
jgi:DNA-binding NtrC family response regulator